jgi:hypothetical protein
MKNVLLIALFLYGCRSDKGVTVFNPPPEAEITSHGNGSALIEGFLTSFVGNVDDANHNAEELTTIWKTDSVVLCEEAAPESNGTTSCEAMLSPETTTITLEVKDAKNALGSHSIFVEVIPSSAPTCSLQSPLDGETYYSDQLITFVGVLTDEEDDAALLNAIWSSSLDSTLTSLPTIPDFDGRLQGYAQLSEGLHAIELRGLDSTGKTCIDSAIIEVGPPNTPPTCSITSPENDEKGSMGEVTLFTAQADDVDVPEDLLTASWSSDKDGILGDSVVNSDGSIAFPFSDLSSDTHVITLTVADETEATCTSSIVYSIGSSPVVSIDSPLDGSVHSEGENITFQVSVTDNDTAATELDLQWLLNGSNYSNTGASATGIAEISDATLNFGSYQLEVIATDVDGYSNVDIVDFTINGIPSQPSVDISPATPYTNDELILMISIPSVDPEGETVGYTFEWYKDGVLQPSHTSINIPETETTKDEMWSVHVTPNDGITNGPKGEASVVIANTPPISPSISVSPNSAIVGQDDLMCTIDTPSTDVDGDSISYQYDWSDGNGVNQQTSTTTDMSDSILSSLLTEGNWTCTVQPFDGTEFGPSVSASLAVESNCPQYGDGASSECPALDCDSIMTNGHSTGDGIYWIDPISTGPFEVFCDMSTDGGGWTQLVDHDYSTDSCPSGWVRSTSFSTVCTRQTTSSSDVIRSTIIDSFGIQYEEVLGYVEGYQYGSNDGFGDNPPNNINDTYGDVISITNMPASTREHLFSYAVGFGTSNNDDSNCPGVNGGSYPPSFVGNDYYCETANTSGNGPSSQWYTTPIYQNYWFQVLSNSTDSEIEARIIGTDVSSDEDIGVGKMELYIR